MIRIDFSNVFPILANRIICALDYSKGGRFSKRLREIDKMSTTFNRIMNKLERDLGKEGKTIQDLTPEQKDHLFRHLFYTQECFSWFRAIVVPERKKPLLKVLQAIRSEDIETISHLRKEQTA